MPMLFVPEDEGSIAACRSHYVVSKTVADTVDREDFAMFSVGLEGKAGVLLSGLFSVDMLNAAAAFDGCDDGTRQRLVKGRNIPKREFDGRNG